MSNMQDAEYADTTDNHFRDFRFTVSLRSDVLLEKILVF